MRKSTTKRTSNNPKGRPKKNGSRKAISAAIDSMALNWLDENAKNNQSSRNDLLNSLLHMAGVLQMSGHLAFTKFGGVSFRYIPDPDLIVDQVENGMIHRGKKTEPVMFVFGNEKARGHYNRERYGDVEFE